MLDVKDFVNWAYGNLLDNTTRGVVAEYLVHKALNSSTTNRINWDGYDILYKNIKIEVKASGYIQHWNKKGQYSKIRFDISKKNPWLAEHNKWLGRVCRYSDIWIFCVHKEKDFDQANALDESQWIFYCTTSKWLDKNFADQKNVSLKVIIKIGLESVNYKNLKKHIDNLIETEI